MLIDIVSLINTSTNQGKTNNILLPEKNTFEKKVIDVHQLLIKGIDIDKTLKKIIKVCLEVCLRDKSKIKTLIYKG